jgi:hypothetical protein
MQVLHYFEPQNQARNLIRIEWVGLHRNVRSLVTAMPPVKPGGPCVLGGSARGR